MSKKMIKRHIPLILLIGCNILFAILFGHTFGESWDDQPRYEVAVEAIEDFTHLEPSKRISGKGPIYYVLAKLFGDFVRLINPSLSPLKAWHYSHFLTFLGGVIAFYLISLRYLSPQAAFISTALFNTQPVLFGHAFINPKDIPFMASFLLIIASGLIMVDKLPDKPEDTKSEYGLRPIINAAGSDWMRLPFFKKALILTYSAVGMLGILFLIVRDEMVKVGIQQFINEIQNPIVYKFFDKVAELVFSGTIKSGIRFNNVERAYPLLIMGLFFAFLIGMIAIIMIFFPRSFRYLTGYSPRRSFFSDLSRVAKIWEFYPAALILGLAVNNRSLSVFAGGLVLFYLWSKKKRFFLPTAFFYGGVTIVVLYMTWPGLWGNPVTGLLKSFVSDTAFSWGGRTLFRGEAYRPSEIPFYYLPFLMAVQFTISAVFLFFLGIYKLLRKYRQEVIEFHLLIIFLVWFLIPYAASVISKPSIYHNFRHFLFITPPIFLIAGLGIKFLFERVPHKVWKWVVSLLVLLPGILGITKLHPYQYIYYNSIVGGVQGAFREYENDYWVTSFEESIDFVNKIASPGDVVLVYGPEHLVKNRLRKDLELENLRLKSLDEKREQQLEFQADFAIMQTRMNHDLSIFPEKEVLFQVERCGAILSVVKDLRD